MKLPVASKATAPRQASSFPTRAKRALRDVLVGPLSLKQLVVLCRELKTTTDAGIPVVRALHVVAEHTGAIRLRRLLRHMAEQIRQGASFGDTVEWHRGRFPAFFREMVASGEASGKLHTAFDYLAEHYETRLRLRQAIINAISYPLAVAVVVGLMPVIQSVLAMFAGVPHADPAKLLTAYALSMTVFIAKLWLLIRLRVPQALWQMFGGHLPYLAPVARGFALGRFFQSLAMLLESGMSVPRAVERAARVAGNVPIAFSLSTAPDLLRKGSTLTEALSVSPYITETARAMVAVGEKSGKVDAALRKVSQYAQNEAMHRLRTFIVSLEVLLIILLGSAIFRFF